MEFQRLVASAYEHLYDLVYLRTHPLADLLLPDPAMSPKDRAWRLHHALLDVIDDLDPGSQAPTFSHEWRRHRLMVLRYVDGLGPQSVANQLAIGRRHFYREQEAAIEAIAALLKERCAEGSLTSTPGDVSETAADRPQLLRQEAARAAQGDSLTDVAQVIAALSPLLEERLEARWLAIKPALPDALPRVAMERSLLRQLLLAMLGYLIERAQGATIRISAASDGAHLRLSVAVEPAQAVQAGEQTAAQERLAALQELATLGGARLLLADAGQIAGGLELLLPLGLAGTVLVVDDNEDTLELFRRYLSRDRQVVCARTAQEGLALATRLQPQAITLDLMMPEHDGWDLLHLLLTRPETRHIPIVVCSILRQEELALSLGATAFLVKPVSEEALLSVLHSVASHQH